MAKLVTPLSTVTVSLPLANTNPDIVSPTTLPPTVNVGFATELAAAVESSLEHPAMNAQAARAKKIAVSGDGRRMLVRRMLGNPD
jgi:hypothetical protein